MKLLNWGPHSKWMLAGLSSLAGAALVCILWEAGTKSGAIDPYAWLYWKANAVKGFTQNPGYVFLTLHTIFFGVATMYVVKIYGLLKKGVQNENE